MRIRLLVVVLLMLAALPLAAQDPAPEYRAYWAETFNTQLGTRADIDRLIDNCVASNCNALFAQVRRRGDSWYLDTLEPLTQVTGVGEPDANGNWTYDPLRYLVDRAHERNIEVHAYVIIGTIYNGHPTITGTPRDPKHAFNTHFWNKAAGALYPQSDPRQWSTRALLHNIDSTTTFDGHRFNGEWYIDLGHPDAAAYTVDVLAHLVRQYDVDGIHLDRIRYPEAPIDRVSGRPLGINIGYNETNVNRFKARVTDAASYYQTSDIGTVINTTPQLRVIASDVGYPKTNDAQWNNWRREQVTNFVRRLYLTTTAIKPRIKVSAALICFFTGPTGSNGWNNTEAYYRVFQDWKAWTEEGILDLVAPMDYKAEHTTATRVQYEDYLNFTRALTAANGRQSLIGLGVYLNGIEGSLIQTRKALARPPYQTQTPADGVIFYALGSTIPGVGINSTNVNVTSNPFSYPTPNVTTPKRPNADFFSAVRTGAGVNGTLFEPTSLAPLFPSFVGVPDMPWKSTPTAGHLMGFAPGTDGAIVTIESLDGGASRTTRTDGGGFYGALKLAPGRYQSVSGNLFSYPTTVTAGLVASADLQVDDVAPQIAIDMATSYVYGEVATPVFSCTDALSGVTSCVATPFDIASTGEKTFTVTSTDRAGNNASQSVAYTVNKADTTIAVTMDVGRNTVTFTATVTPVAPGGGPVTGRVTFDDQFSKKDVIGSAQLHDGVATITVQRRAYKLTVAYEGSENHNPIATEELHFIPN